MVFSNAEISAVKTSAINPNTEQQHHFQEKMTQFLWGIYNFFLICQTEEAGVAEFFMLNSFQALITRDVITLTNIVLGCS